MDHGQLLEQITAKLDERTEIMRGDIKELDRKMDSFQERLVKVESEQGFIRLGFKLLMGGLSTIVAYLAAKVFDFKV